MRLSTPYEAWTDRHSDDLEGIEPIECATIYAYVLDGIDIDTAKMMAVKDAAIASHSR